jgi:diaminopimelate epimerase
MPYFKFSKMHGNGNDFLVFNALDSGVKGFNLDINTLKKLADRHMGIGADQILVVEKSSDPNCDFRYRIFNADGGEVEQCGNGARCFTRFVYEKKLTNKAQIAIETKAGIIRPERMGNGLIKVDMGQPHFDLASIGFDAEGLESKQEGQSPQWLYPTPQTLPSCTINIPPFLPMSVVSMGNPHTVMRFDMLNDELVNTLGPQLETAPRFKNRVNVGFLVVKNREHIQLRVYERGAGETLACGTGACAAVVIGVQSGWLDHKVQVDTRGGALFIEWGGNKKDSVFLSGDAQFVFDFEGEVNL